MPIGLDHLVGHLPAWAMVTFRVAGIFLVTPVFSGRGIPTRLKVFIAAALGLCVYPLLWAPGSGSAAALGGFIDNMPSVWALPGVIISELAVGLVLGMALTMPLLGMEIAGQKIDHQMGLAMAQVYNAAADAQVGVAGNFLFWLGVVVMLIFGGHRVLLTVLLNTFQNVPPGEFVLGGHALELVLGLLASAFELAVRVSAPVVCVIFIQTLAMGFVAKTVPQMNILSIGFALRVLLGVLVMAVTIYSAAEIFGEALTEALEWMSHYMTTWTRG